LVYCANSHLAERLPEIKDPADFKDLKAVVTQTLKIIEKQIDKISTIIKL